MHSVLASIASSCLVLQVLGSTLESTRFNYQFGNCKGVKDGLNLAKVNDGSAPINEACHSGSHCKGSRSCCVAVGTCVAPNGTRGVFVHSKKEYYEGGCSPKSVDKSHEDYDPKCTQVGECVAGYLYQSKQAFSVEMSWELPKATLERLMAGSNWCSHTQRCQDEPCVPPPDLTSCTGVQSGINLPKPKDGVKALNEPCHSRAHCQGSIHCCATIGTCVPTEKVTRGVFVHNNKAYFEGGCSPRSLDKSHADYDPDCKQVGECHQPYLLKTKKAVAKPGAMTPLPAAVLNRLMKGSNWNEAAQTCGTQTDGDMSHSSPLHMSLGLMSLMVFFWG